MAKMLPASKAPTFGRIIERLNLLPPFFIYYAAGHNYRNGKRRLPHQRTPASRPNMKEFSRLANMPERTFARIASKLCWDEVKAKHIDPFCFACGVDVLRIDALRRYVRKSLQSGRKYSHLNERELKRFESMSARFLKMQEEKAVTLAAAGKRAPENQGG